jgi:hypothetical protein
VKADFEEPNLSYISHKNERGCQKPGFCHSRKSKLAALCLNGKVLKITF